MQFVKIGTEMYDELKSLQKDYKVAIGFQIPLGNMLAYGGIVC